jgi:hypothetical protein
MTLRGKNPASRLLKRGSPALGCIAGLVSRWGIAGIKVCGAGGRQPRDERGLAVL